MWFDKYSFVNDPYEKLDPYRIDFDRLVWDRPDLSKAKDDMDKYVGEVISGKRIALKVFGPAGCGKTWLTRIIQKDLQAKLGAIDKEMVFLYTRVPRIEPTFQIVYRIGIDHFLSNYFVRLTECYKCKDVEAWEKLLKDHDLALIFSNFASGSTEKKALARRWLMGDKLSGSELSKLDLTYSLDSDYERFEMFRKLIEKLLNVYPVFVFVIDELENAPTKLAGQISDVLRDLLDSFSERFALITSFTAQKIEEWFDLGYTEALNRRFDYAIELGSLEKTTIVEFLRIHHRAYRKKGVKVEDETYPFTEVGIVRLLDLMSPQYHYPGYFLPNCKEVVRVAEGKTVKIDDEFVEKNFQAVSFK